MGCKKEENGSKKVHISKKGVVCLQLGATDGRKGALEAGSGKYFR
jgi:hypothetical protein